MKHDYTEVGKSLKRADGPDKVKGEALYTDDMALPRMVYGKIKRSPHAHAKIKKVDYSKALALPGALAVVTGADGPIQYGIVPQVANETFLAVDKVRYWGEGVAAVAAEDEETAAAALELIEVEYEILPALVDPLEAMKRDDVRIHEENEYNIFYEGEQLYGEPDKAFAEAAYVLERDFFSSYVNHAFLEPQSSLAHYDLQKGELLLYSSTQIPHYLHAQLAKVMEMPMHKIRVSVPTVGGGFGGKGVASQADFTASILSRKIGRPVKVTYERSEVFATNNGRHPCYMKMKIGLDKDGIIQAVEFDNTLDGGAYSGWGVVVLFYTASMIHLPYKVPHTRFRGRRIYTNKPTAGAMRGLGGLQPRFAMESMLDELAGMMGISPYELRMKNAVESGHTCASEMYVPHSEYKKCLQTVVEKSGYLDKYGKLPFGKGIGLAGGYYISGTSYTLYMSYKPHCVATIRVDTEGGVTLYCGSTDIGQGSNTVMAQMAAETLGIKGEDVHVVSQDTELAPFDLGTFASRLTYANGWAIRRAADKINEELFTTAASMMNCRAEEVMVKNYNFCSKYEKKKKVGWNDVVTKHIESKGPLTATGQFSPPRRKGVQQGGNIGHSPTFGFSAQVVELDVDLKTGKIRVSKVTEAGDCGVAINPLSVEGQVEGSIMMGMGQALYEEMVIAPDGTFLNPSLHDYKVPTSMELPEMDCTIVESYDQTSAYGAKESGEGPIQPIIPAIANAVYDAVGLRMTEMPFTPEKVLNGLKRENTTG